jgi:uncharacterized surface anchored protein
MKRALILSIATALFVTAANAATIRGKVVYANGAPCAGAEAKAADAANRQTTEAYTDRDGMFYIHDVPPGRYTVFVIKNRTRKAVPVTVTAAPYAEVGTVPVQ